MQRPSASASDPDDFSTIKIVVLYVVLPLVTLLLIVFVMFYRRARFLFENAIDHVFEFLVEVVFDIVQFVIRRDQHSRRQQVIEHIDCSDFDKRQQRGSTWIVCVEEVHYAEEGGEEDTCSICLEEYMVGDTMLKLPKCGHFYHRNCLNSWFLTGPSVCPVCRCPVGDSL